MLLVLAKEEVVVNPSFSWTWFVLTVLALHKLGKVELGVGLVVAFVELDKLTARKAEDHVT